MNRLRDIPLILVIIMASSCGLPFLKDHQSKDGTREFHTTDPVFVPYIQKFEQAGKSRTGDPNFVVGDIPIQFREIENQQFQGVCEVFADGTKQIKIRKSWWDAQSDEFRESLIFHELGHCRLDRPHDNEMVTVENNELKVSMMNEYIVSPIHYKTYREAYLDELFTNSNTSVLTAFQQ